MKLLPIFLYFYIYYLDTILFYIIILCYPVLLYYIILYYLYIYTTVTSYISLSKEGLPYRGCQQAKGQESLYVYVMRFCHKGDSCIISFLKVKFILFTEQHSITVLKKM